MTTYQIITVVISMLGLAGGMIAAYVRLKTDLAKVQAKLAELEINQSRLHDDKADHDLVMSHHKETNSKLDQMSAQINIIVNRLIQK